MHLYAYKYTSPLGIWTRWSLDLILKTHYNITASTALLENVYHNNMIKDTINH